MRKKIFVSALLSLVLMMSFSVTAFASTTSVATYSHSGFNSSFTTTAKVSKPTTSDHRWLNVYSRSDPYVAGTNNPLGYVNTKAVTTDGYAMSSTFKVYHGWDWYPKALTSYSTTRKDMKVKISNPYSGEYTVKVYGEFKGTYETVD